MGKSMAHAQAIDNSVSYRNMSANKYFRFHYENDYFSGTDIYYTQGILFEYANPVIRKFFLTKILIGSDHFERKYGISLELNGYTPTSIQHTEILVGDRPFASCLFLKTFLIANDSIRKLRISSSLSTGVIGPAALGEEIQTTIHRWLHDKTPMGWSNQIQNDVVLNYQADVEKCILSSGSFIFNAKAGGHIGTLSDKVYGGFTLMAGHFDNPFSNFSKQGKSFQVYLFLEPLINVVGYDATLQGGMFNKSSPYTIPASEINRIVFQNNYGIVFKIKKMYLEYFQTYLTKEFETGGEHKWGGIRVGRCFN
jgi:lipid A 3-O-deacylase